MPYYIFRSGPVGSLESLGEYPGFRDAKARVNALRETLPASEARAVRMIFADNEMAAIDALTQPRERDLSLAGDDT